VQVPRIEGASRTDQALARRLERTEAAGNAGFVEARARLNPDHGSTWIEVAGAYAMFDGLDSPITQTFGLGMFAPLEAADLNTIESFFLERGAATHHEVCPLSDPAHLVILSERGYRPIEQSTVLCQSLPLSASPTGRPGAGVTARLMAPGEEDLWIDTSVAGWSSAPEVAFLVRGFAEIMAKGGGAGCFVAELEGRAIATGAMVLHDGVALLAGASTVPEWRGRGAQAALLAARLRYAAEQGADLAMMAALPGSQSQLNAERQGFRICYTRTKWGSRIP
jgi:GNAT superfamily N-acetyltransferase